MYKYENLYKFSWSRYQVYKARKQLAAIDWNYHVNRATSMNEHGEAWHTRKYNQRTKEWNTRVVKVPKDFGYIPIMMAKIFKRQFEDRNPIDRHVSLSEDDPARIAPTIAAVPPLSSKELYIRHQSRFSKCKTDLFSAKQWTRQTVLTFQWCNLYFLTDAKNGTLQWFYESATLWSNFRIWIRFLERWIIYISLIFKKNIQMQANK